MHRSRPLFRALAALTAAAATFPLSAHANVGETYGFGARAAALSATGAATGYNAYASYYNPAALPQAAGTDRRLALDLGVVYMSPSFLPINNVTITNTYTGGSNTTGNVDVSYRETLGQAIGLSYRLLDEPTRLTVGLTAFLPINQVAYIDSGEVYVPEYVLYRARTQRPQIEFGLGARLSEQWRVGAGLHLAFGLTTNATVYLQTAQTNQPSTMRFIASMKAKLSPYFGIQFVPTGVADQLAFGAVVRLPATSDNSMIMRSAAHVGFPQAIDFSFLANSSLFYDPLTLELGGAWEHFDGWRLTAQVDYQIWNAFQPPALTVQNCTESTCNGVPISPTLIPGYNYRNVVIPRMAEEITAGNWVFRLGYAYRPSFMSGPPTGAGNYLDPDKHMASVGVGRLMPQFLGSDIPARLDLNFSYHQLITQRVDKTAGDEAGNPANSKIGSPGYDAGGKILGGGVSLSLAI